MNQQYIYIIIRKLHVCCWLFQLFKVTIFDNIYKKDKIEKKYIFMLSKFYLKEFELLTKLNKYEI